MDTTKNRYVLADGQLSQYALGCGYRQRASDTGDNLACDLTLDLWRGSACWLVTARSDEKGRFLWESFTSLTEARKFWADKVRDLKLAKHANGRA